MKVDPGMIVLAIGFDLVWCVRQRLPQRFNTPQASLAPLKL